MIAKKTLYTNADKTKIVAEDSAEAAFLLVREGSEIPADAIDYYKLNEPKTAAPVAAVKSKTPSENK